MTNVIGGAAKRMCLEKKRDFLGYSINFWCVLVSFIDYFFIFSDKTTVPCFEWQVLIK